MAILNQIRQRSFFLIVVIAMALFSFVLADVFRNTGTSDMNTSSVGSVNGIEIERDDFMRKVDNVEKQNRGSRSAIQSMSNIWDQEIKKLVLKTEFDEIGLRVEKNMMRSLLKNNLSAFDEFKDGDGNFDESKLNQFILNLKEISPETTELQNSLVNYESWNIFESNIAAFGLEQSYNKLVEAGINTTIFEGLTDHHFNNDLVDFEYVKIPFSNLMLISILTTIKTNIKQPKVELSLLLSLKRMHLLLINLPQKLIYKILLTTEMSMILIIKKISKYLVLDPQKIMKNLLTLIQQ